jgi:DNA-binding MarR family transcriptional regulator
MPSTTNDRLAFDSKAQEVFLHLWRTYDCLKAVEDEAFAQFGISPQQYNALRLLEEAAPLGMQTLELGRKMISRKPDTTRLLDRLEKTGYVTRHRLENNRRVVEVRISRHGSELLKRMRNVIDAMHHQQLGHLSDQQAQQLVRLLKTARRPHDDASCNWMD